MRWLISWVKSLLDPSKYLMILFFVVDLYAARFQVSLSDLPHYYTTTHLLINARDLTPYYAEFL